VSAEVRGQISHKSESPGPCAAAPVTGGQAGPELALLTGLQRSVQDQNSNYGLIPNPPKPCLHTQVTEKFLVLEAQWYICIGSFMAFI